MMSSAVVTSPDVAPYLRLLGTNITIHHLINIVIRFHDYNYILFVLGVQLLNSYLTDKSQIQMNIVKSNPHTVSCCIP